MPIRRLTRTPALSAASLSALLAPYGGAMRPEAHKSVGSAPNCRGIVSMTNRRDNSAHTLANGVLRSHSTISGRHSQEQSSRGEECQTSTRDQAEQPDGRVHRRTQCRKRQRVADAPRFNGSVLPASVERLRHGSPAELYRPSRLLMRHSGGLLYVPKDL